jgi:hypothetical protein
MTSKEKIELYCNKKRYCKIEREIGQDVFVSHTGFIVDFSSDYLVLQETDDFIIRGFLIFSIESIKELRSNKSDRFFEKIYKKEGLTKKIKKKHKVNLSSWETILKSIKKLGFNVIIKDENPDENTFDIGPIIKVTKKSVHIQYFDAAGILDDEPTKIYWKNISLVSFDDIYVNTISKYIK